MSSLKCFFGSLEINIKYLDLIKKAYKISMFNDKGEHNSINQIEFG